MYHEYPFPNVYPKDPKAKVPEPPGRLDSERVNLKVCALSKGKDVCLIRFV